MKSMWKRLIVLLLLLLLSGAVLTACGGGEEEEERSSARDDDDEEEEEEEEEPADEEDAGETMDEEAAAAVIDTAAFVTAASEVSGISIDHPADWVVEVTDTGDVTISSSQEFMDAADGITVDGAVISLTSFPLEFLEFMATTDEGIDGTDPAAVVEVFSNLITDEGLGENVTFTLVDGPTPTTIAGYEAATITFDIEDAESGNNGIIRLVAVLDGTDRAVMGVTAVTDDVMETDLPLVEAVLETMVLQPPVLEAAEMDEEPVEVTEEPPTNDAAMVTGVPSLPGAPEMFADVPMPALESGQVIYSNGNEVNDIALHDGLVYAATDGGLVAWDYAAGSPVAKWTTLNGLGHNVAPAITVCDLPETRIVVGTNNGLSLYDPASDTFENWTPENSGMGSDAGVESLTCVPQLNTLVVGYQLDGIDVYEAGSGAWTYYAPFDQLESGFANDVAVKGDLEEIWIAHIASVSVIRADGSITFYDDENGLDDLNTDDFEHFVDDIVVDNNGTVWFAQGGGLTRVDAGDTFTFIASDDVPGWPFWSGADNITVGPDGTLWTNTVFGGICNYDPASNSCLTTFEDEEGMADDFNNTIIVNDAGIFYGSDGEGVSYYDGAAWANYQLDELPETNRFAAIAQAANGDIWLGGDFGLVTFPAADADTAWVDIDSFVGVNTLYPRPNGMWVGSNNGASFFDYESGEWTVLEPSEEPGAGLYDIQVNAIAQDELGQMWFGTSGGVTMWNGENFTWYDLLTEEERSDERSPRWVNTVLADGQYVWAGGTNALYRFDIATGEFVRWDDANGLPGFIPTVNAMALDADGNLLIALDRVLYNFDREGSFTELYAAEAPIRSILIDELGDWVLGTSGAGAIFLIDGSWASLTTADGLPADNYNGSQSILVDYLGGVWFAAGEGGILRIIP